VKPVNEWNFGYIIPIGIFLFVLCVIYSYIKSLKVFVFNRGSELFIIGTLLYLLNEFTLGLKTIQVELFAPGVTVTAVGIIILTWGICRVILRDKDRERKIRAEYNLFQTLMDHIPDSIYFKDNKGRFVRVNKMKAEHYKTISEKMIGKTDFNFLSKEEARECFADDNWVIKNNKSIINKIEEITHSNGIKHWVSVTKVPWYNEKKEIIGTFGISRDITQHKQIEERDKSLNFFYREMGRAINWSKNANEFCRKILENLKNVVDYDMGNLLVYYPKRKLLLNSAQIGYPKDLEERTIKKQKVEEGISRVGAFCALNKKTVYIEDMKEHKLTEYAHDLCKRYDLSQIYAVPLITKEELEGVLEIIVKSGKILSKENREFLDGVAEEMAVALRKIKVEGKLQDLVRKDYLTDLYNYRHLCEKLDEQKSRGKRYNEIYSLLYIDVDGFKSFNDTYGHLKGDEVLRNLAKIFHDCMRKADSAYRYGGEEFVILLLYISKKQANQVAERIREKVYHYFSPEYRITVSIGVTDSQVGGDIVGRADQAMYKAKRKGKNRVEVD